MESLEESKVYPIFVYLIRSHVPEITICETGSSFNHIDLQSDKTMEEK
jgi:hypothetical protein